MSTKVLVGDEFGLLKLVDIEKKLVIGKYGEMKRQNTVLGISNLFENNKDILAVACEKNFYVLNWAEGKVKSDGYCNFGEKMQVTSQVVKRTIDFSSAILAKNDNKLSVFRFDEDFNMTPQELDTDTVKLQIIRDAPSTQEIFCLYRDNPIKIFDLERGKMIWSAKNVPNNEYDIKQGMFDTDVAYSKQNPNLFYTSTAYGEIRSYDRKIRPRPMKDNKIYDKKINRVVLSNCENYLTVGDIYGSVYMLDKRKNFANAKSLKGSTGSIRDIIHIKNSTLTLTCGLDRHLRVYNYKTGEDLPQIYMKNQLSSILPYEVNSKQESSSDHEDSENLMEEGEFSDEEEEKEVSKKKCKTEKNFNNTSNNKKIKKKRVGSQDEKPEYDEGEEFRDGIEDFEDFENFEDDEELVVEEQLDNEHSEPIEKFLFNKNKEKYSKQLIPKKKYIKNKKLK